MSRFLVWIKCNAKQAELNELEEGVWMTNGDGPMSRKTADRVARDIGKSFKGIRTRVLPEKQKPE